jgi:hypothetical protein
MVAKPSKHGTLTSLLPCRSDVFFAPLHPLILDCRNQPPSFGSSPLQYLVNRILPFTPFERAGLARTEWWQRWSSGYGKQQGTRPQTIGYALADSPIGLLAWIYEKLVEWSDEYPWTDDEGAMREPLSLRSSR